MNTSSVSPSLAALGLNEQQIGQQADLAHRLLAMACTGTPTLGPDSKLPPKLLALHALATTYMALASTEPALTGVAASLAVDIAEHLDDIHERREREAEEALYSDVNAAFRAHAHATGSAFLPPL